MTVAPPLHEADTPCGLRSLLCCPPSAAVQCVDSACPPPAARPPPRSHRARHDGLQSMHGPGNYPGSEGNWPRAGLLPPNCPFSGLLPRSPPLPPSRLPWRICNRYSDMMFGTFRLSCQFPYLLPVYHCGPYHISFVFYCVAFAAALLSRLFGLP